jgi:hypothetical protein
MAESRADIWKILNRDWEDFTLVCYHLNLE